MRAFIAFGIKKTLSSEEEVIATIKQIPHSDLPIPKILYSSEEEAKKRPYDKTTEKLLIVQVEKIEISTSYDQKIGALYQFGFCDDEATPITYQPFSPKYRKLGLLKACVNGLNLTNVSAFLNVITPKELHGLAETLLESDNSIDRKKLRNALDWIIAHFSDQNNVFQKHTFTEEEFENVRNGMLKFKYSSDIRPNFDPNNPDDEHYDNYYARSTPETFKADYLSSTRQNEIFFNKYGELKKQVHYNNESHTYEVTGTLQQITRWILLKQYGKQEADKLQEHHADTNKNTKDSLPLLKCLFFSSAEESKRLICEGEKMADPFYIAPVSDDGRAFKKQRLGIKCE